MADYQVRNWAAWHHHQTLSLLAAWFLNRETRRGKNPDPALTTPQLRQLIWRRCAAEAPVGCDGASVPGCTTTVRVK